IGYLNSISKNPDPAAANQLLAIGTLSPIPGAHLPYALDCIQHVADKLGIGLTVVTGGQISGIDFKRFSVVYVCSDNADVDGGITNGDIDRLAARKADIYDYVTNTGGSWLALSELRAKTPYSWMPGDPVVVKATGGNIVTQTVDAPNW